MYVMILNHTNSCGLALLMNLVTLRQFDLNSLVVLKLLLETKHVTRAAEQLNLTQSAVSRTLGKLREAFQDPLLVRSGKGLLLTKNAEQLLPLVNQALEQISVLLDPIEFSPKDYEGTLRLATTDYGTNNLLPKLVPLLQEAAPKLSLSTVDWRSSLLTELEHNQVDLMIGGVTSPPDNIHQRIVAQDNYAGVIRKSHPSEGKIDLQEYIGMNHIVISSSGTSKSPVDDYLKSIGQQRKVALTVPHFFAALEIIAATDYMILLPSGFIRRYVDQDKFTVVSAPFPIPPLEIAMFWHARMHHDPMHRWFRQFIYDNLYARHDRYK